MSFYISIDPGNKKCGLLLADIKSRKVIEAGITSLNKFSDLVSFWNKDYDISKIIIGDAEQTYKNYEEMLNQRYDGSVIDEDKIGLARELARMNLTLNTYTQWYWKTDLLNLMNFLRLRADHHAQYEIRAYADIENML